MTESFSSESLDKNFELFYEDKNQDLKDFNFSSQIKTLER